MKLQNSLPQRDLDTFFGVEKPSQEPDPDWFKKINEQCNVPPEVTDKWVTELELKSQREFLLRLDRLKRRKNL